ncbi:hypothetical protein N7476_011588 [Penicillium atrosanguineum]|uniref:Uncharacterized protein n=1 Tax=Penicillium atrosanguineum TaxID=1132637 RepID=A0A9W9PMV4_9EURO|nr:hypothetical protein N7476_011588 [Penicillium atrosanguineum]
MNDNNVPFTEVDGVRKFPANGVKTIIVGAGVGGLGAALECWRKRCDVVVLERAYKLSPLGDFFYHASVWPDDFEVTNQHPEWKRLGAIYPVPDVEVSFIKRRAVFAQMQLDQLTRFKVPVLWGRNAVSLRESGDAVVVTADTDEQVVGDMCIVTDGIGSTLQGFIISGDLQVQDSDYAIARVAFPRNAIKDGSPAATLLENVEVNGQFRTYLARDVHLISFLTKDWVAWAYTHKVNPAFS